MWSTKQCFVSTCIDDQGKYCVETKDRNKIDKIQTFCTSTASLAHSCPLTPNYPCSYKVFRTVLALLSGSFFNNLPKQHCNSRRLGEILTQTNYTLKRRRKNIHELLNSLCCIQVIPIYRVFFMLLYYCVPLGQKNLLLLQRKAFRALSYSEFQIISSLPLAWKPPLLDELTIFGQKESARAILSLY